MEFCNSRRDGQLIIQTRDINRSATAREVSHATSSAIDQSLTHSADGRNMLTV